MKTLYLDCSMGAAGDMITGALLELVQEQEIFLSKINSLMDGVDVVRERTKKCGITGTHVSVRIKGREERSEDVNVKGHVHSHGHTHSHHEGGHTHEHEGNTAGGHSHSHAHGHHHHHDHDHEHHHSHDHGHDHHHSHDHGHDHHHTGLQDIREIVAGFDISDKVKDDIISIYQLIAEAESKAHDTEVSKIHFHEVGDKDAIIDITSVCLLMDMISPDEVVVSPIHVGSGYVKCAHGILPVPAPATAYILKDVPVYGGNVEGELCTPTGAALLKHFADRFSKMPYMITKSIGYGMGTKDFEIANCVRAIIGENGKINEGEREEGVRNIKKNLNDTQELSADSVSELSFNVDDMTAEDMAFAMERLYEAGAKEVFTVPIGMKKSRPGTLIKVLCYKEDREKMVETIFRHTSTIGIREAVVNRYVLDRREEEIETPHGKVKRKISEGYGVKKTKFEYDDIARIAKVSGKSLDEVKKDLGSTELSDEGV